MHNDASSKEENDFMTPIRSFSKSNKKVHKGNGSAAVQKDGTERTLFSSGKKAEQ